MRINIAYDRSNIQWTMLSQQLKDPLKLVGATVDLTKWGGCFVIITDCTKVPYFPI